MTDEDGYKKTSVLSHRGSRRALSLINDVVRGRKKAVLFYIDRESGQLIESHTELSIEVNHRTKGPISDTARPQ